MIQRQNSAQLKQEFVCIEDMVPKDHLLRKIDRHINFSFIYDKTKDLYSNVGRRGIAPEVLFKMMLIGYLFGIRSERRLGQEVKVNVAYRWFLGLGFPIRFRTIRRSVKTVGVVSRHLAEATYWVLTKHEPYREPKSKVNSSTAA